ncbi:DEAD-box ATP-dependent RNA helicase 34 [Zea mays]|uniref:DEAD-box ATP-dependent RNA helicase 34 n=2 Tax=Eukaryota TaxID=2759 RepID=A0A1D6QA34_MAIZE
MPMNVADLI